MSNFLCKCMFVTPCSQAQPDMSQLNTGQVGPTQCLQHFIGKVDYLEAYPRDYDISRTTGDDDETSTAEVHSWDRFQDPMAGADEGSMADQTMFDNLEKAAKIFTYLLAFVTILTCAVLSKGTLLFMTSQISDRDTKRYCNRDFGTGKEFIVTLPTTERVMWIWILFVAYCIPQVGTAIRSLRIMSFKTFRLPNIGVTLCIIIPELCSSVGWAILIYGVLPEMDVIKGAMISNAVCFIPVFFLILSRTVQCDFRFNSILDFVSIIGQVSALVLWPMLIYSEKRIMWLMPLALVLISMGWWENFTPERCRIEWVASLCRTNKAFANGRYFVYFFCSLVKCAAFLVTMLTIYGLREENIAFLFDNAKLAFSNHYINVTEVLPLIGSSLSGSLNYDSAVSAGPSRQILTSALTPWWVLLINALSTYILYAFSKFTYKIQIQNLCFALPINLAVPVTLIGLLAMCGEYTRDICTYYDVLPRYLFFDPPSLATLDEFILNELGIVWVIWLISQAWTTNHIWATPLKSLQRTEKIFLRPMYEAFFADQDLPLNRRRDDHDIEVENNEIEEEQLMQCDISESSDHDEDSTPMIYACGTMWHETTEEMMAFLKSIFRLDYDQCKFEIIKERVNPREPKYYNLETHIFFDDAFDRRDKDDNDPQLNIYVRRLVSAIDEAASTVHGWEIEIDPPDKSLTPYGGRLCWTLPGGTKMYAHLKDKAKIRPKKRWSQVMYMYYLLGHRLIDANLSDQSKAIRAKNTFILALDGDIDFQPKAVHLLVELMKKNDKLGAACGRIHPLGSGPMVWYQKFEYAIGHWLQKATEHMIGCVLCSPGCFSLFRGSALMDDNVMRKYTLRSTEALHYVQYDQGEDRWLCTLLLQRGYRVEYSAASDAYTHCPEKFNEFYNQRRRWMPSTTANIFDLLMNYKRTVKENDNISRLYIFYQLIIMVGTVLGPGTIFLMLVGAFVAAFQLDQWTSFLWNAIPILIFLSICALFNEKIQLFFAGLISAVYGLVMMAVLVGIMLQIQNDGILAPSSLFFFCVAGEMIITALFHPKEIGCLPFGIVYYITVPSMYMLLVIYSVFNMNNVSWGTREVTIIPKAKNENDDEALKAKPEESIKHKIKLLFAEKSSEETKGTLELSIGGLFRCLCCTHTSKENWQLEQMKLSMDVLQQKLETIHNTIINSHTTSQPLLQADAVDSFVRSNSKTVIVTGPSADLLDDNRNFDDLISLTESDTSSSYENTWLFDMNLKRGPVVFIERTEHHFWKEFIKKYLEPYGDRDAETVAALKDLRDKSVFAFFMLNFIFVLVVFLLTLKKDDIHVEWPFGVKSNFTYLDDTADVEVIKEFLQLEPIGFVFVIFFAILLVVQFVAMILHRFGTLSQILVNTDLKFKFLKKKKSIDDTDFNDEEYIHNLMRHNERKRHEAISRRISRITSQVPTTRVTSYNVKEQFHNRVTNDPEAKSILNRRSTIHRRTTTEGGKRVTIRGHDNNAYVPGDTNA